MVFQTGRSARIDNYGSATGPAAESSQEWGMRAVVAVPSTVAGQEATWLWAATFAGQLRLDVVLLAGRPVRRGVDVIGAGVGHCPAGAWGRLARAAMAAARPGQIRVTPSLYGFTNWRQPPGKVVWPTSIRYPSGSRM